MLELGGVELKFDTTNFAFFRIIFYQCGDIGVLSIHPIN